MLVESMLGFRARRECMKRWPNPSSPDPRGEDPRSSLRCRDSRPVMLGAWMFRIESRGMWFFASEEPGGDDSRRLNLDGSDAATWPCCLAHETPWLSKDAGKGASRTLRRLLGENDVNLESSRGEPYFDSGSGRYSPSFGKGRSKGLGVRLSC